MISIQLTLILFTMISYCVGRSNWLMVHSNYMKQFVWILYMYEITFNQIILFQNRTVSYYKNDIEVDNWIFGTFPLIYWRRKQKKIAYYPKITFAVFIIYILNCYFVLNIVLFFQEIIFFVQHWSFFVCTAW